MRVHARVRISDTPFLAPGRTAPLHSLSRPRALSLSFPLSRSLRIAKCAHPAHRLYFPFSEIDSDGARLVAALIRSRVSAATALRALDDENRWRFDRTRRRENSGRSSGATTTALKTRIGSDGAAATVAVVTEP